MNLSNSSKRCHIAHCRQMEQEAKKCKALEQKITSLKKSKAAMIKKQKEVRVLDTVGTLSLRIRRESNLCGTRETASDSIRRKERPCYRKPTIRS